MEAKYHTIQKLLNKIKNLAIENKTEEICGLIGKKPRTFFLRATKNISRDRRKIFAIDPYEAFIFDKNIGIDIIYHTHIEGSESPSDFDKAMAENSCKAFLIYSLETDRFSILEPEHKDYDVDFVKRLTQKIK